MQRYYGIIRGFAGAGLPYTQVTVYSNAAGTTQPSLYDSAGDGIANPTMTNARGAIDVYSPLGALWYKVSGDTAVQPLPRYSYGGGWANVRDYAGMSDRDAGRAAIASCGTTGGVVLFPPGDYLLSGALLAPVNSTGWVVLSGYGSTITFVDDYLQALLQPATYAPGDVFRRLIIEGFDIDASNLDGANNWIFNLALADASIEQIVVRDVHVYGYPYSPATGGGLVFTTTAPTTTRRINDIVLENVVFEGGFMGAYLGGDTSNVTMDNVTIRDCRHEGVAQDVSVAQTNFQFGGRASCGNLLVSNCYGSGSCDTGIEVDNWKHAVVENCVIEDSLLGAYLVTPFSAPLGGGEPVTIFNNCKARYTTEVWSAQPYGIGFALRTEDDGFSLGSVYLNNCEYYRATDTVHHSTRGEGILLLGDVSDDYRAAISRLVVRDFKYEKSIDTVSGPIDYHEGILLSATGADISISGLEFKCTFDVTGFAQWGAIRLACADSTVHIDDAVFDLDLSCNAAMLNTLVYVTNNGTAAATFDAIDISRVHVKSFAGTETSPFVVYADAPGTADYASLTLRDSDVSAMPAATYVVYSTLGNVAKSKMQNVLCPVAPAPSEAYTKTTQTIDSVSTHPTLPELVTGSAHGMVVGDWVHIDGIAELAAGYYQVVSTDAATHFKVSGTTTGTDTGTCQPCYTNRTYYDIDFVVSGGTVTAIAISTNAGTTFTTTGLTAGIFRLRPGDICHITSSAAPTMVKVPKP